MGDKILDTTQLVSGLAILLSFYVGYKYGLKINESKELPQKAEKNDEPSTSDGSSMLCSDFSDYKMILVVRNDLKMGKGKIAAQCGHAAVGAYQSAVRKYPRIVKCWESSGCKKIAVKVDSEKQLMSIRLEAIAKNFNTCLIRDAGHTQVEPNSKTVLAIGPGLEQELDKITGHLKLL